MPAPTPATPASPFSMALRLTTATTCAALLGLALACGSSSADPSIPAAPTPDDLPQSTPPDHTAAVEPPGTYYIAPTGNDTTGTGTSANPWLTIRHALLQVSDTSTILAKPGTYNGQQRLDGDFPSGVTVRSQVPYQAKLRNTSAVVICYYGRGITLEGFDVAHTGTGAGALVIQIQDLRGTPGGADRVSRINIKNCILHDSYNNDILKINNGCSDVTVSGNVFYNQTGSDEHIDVNSVTDVVIEDNIFFNDFAGSGRSNANDTSSYIVIKDSNQSSDGQVGCDRIDVRRNVFLNWEGSTGSNFVLIGEDGNNYFEAKNVMIENNLMLGNSTNVMRSAFGVKGGQHITFRHNTVAGDLPALAYAMRLNREGSNPANENIRFYNNIWSDPAGTMGAENPTRPNDFSDTPPADTLSFTLARNCYWNGGVAMPSDAAEKINYTNDATRIVTNPQLPSQTGLVLPRWNSASSSFADGSTTQRQAFTKLVNTYGRPAATALRDGADGAQSPATDILGRSRVSGRGPDFGCYEYKLTVKR